jgi:hypothetical protein
MHNGRGEHDIASQRDARAMRTAGTPDQHNVSCDTSLGELRLTVYAEQNAVRYLPRIC